MGSCEYSIISSTNQENSIIESARARALKVKRTAVADELASAAELVIGQSDEAIPAALIRGYNIEFSEESNASQLLRPREKDLFI